MSLTTAQQVRLKISDIPTLADEVLYGDGQTSSFTLPHRNITTGSAFLIGTNGQWSATAATFNTSGVVAFAAVPSAASGIRVTYTYSTFADTDIDQFIESGGDVLGAAVEAVQSLMFDGLRRAAWRASDGSQYDDTRAIQLLKDLYMTLSEEQAEDAISGGDVVSWGGYYG